MTDEPAPSARIVVLRRAEHPYADGYFTALLGLQVKMPAVIENGRVLAGYLTRVQETPEAFTLEFCDLELELAESQETL